MLNKRLIEILKKLETWEYTDKKLDQQIKKIIKERK